MSMVSIKRKQRFSPGLTGAILLWAGLWAVQAAETKEAAAMPPALPRIQSLQIEPEALTLHNARDHRRVLVWGVTEAGKRLDLSAIAEFKTDSTNVILGERGYFEPQAAGAAEVTVSAAGRSAKLPITVKDASNPPVR